jgi:hypothetical protein
MSRGDDPDMRGPTVGWSSARRCVLAVVVISALGACTPTSTDLPPSVSTAPPQAAVAQPNGEPRTVQLSGGRDTITYRVVALDPPTHPFTVDIDATGNPDLAMWFTTDFGTTLHVTPWSRRETSCERTEGQTRCRVFFAELEAQHGGVWVMHIRKRSVEPATITVTVLFETTPAGG